MPSVSLGARGAGRGRGLRDAPRLAVFGTVPLLTSILSTMLPMLSLAKHDSMRVVFCFGERAPLGAGGVSAGRGLGAACFLLGLLSLVPLGRAGGAVGPLSCRRRAGPPEGG